MAPAQRIFLTGFMGAGKTAIGRPLAVELGWEFVDLDEMVAAEAGRSVAQIFAAEGEAGFRRRERAALAALLDRRRLVVATGGGTLADPRGAELVRGRGLVVWIKPPFAKLAERVEEAGPGSRPLYRDRQRARRLYRQRLPSYRQADLVITVAGDDPVERVVRRLVAELGVSACAT